MSFSSQLKQHLQKLDNNAKKKIRKVRDEANQEKGWVEAKMEDVNDNNFKHSQD